MKRTGPSSNTQNSTKRIKHQMSIKNFNDAIERGDVVTVNRMLEQGMDYAAIRQSECLKIAAEKGYVQIIDALIEYGVDVNQRFRNGYTALQNAILNRSTSATIKLLDYPNIDVNRIDTYHRTALHLAASYGNVNVVKALLAKGADIDGADLNGETALHWAARKGQHEVVVTLLKHNASLDCETRRDFETPLHIAARSKYHLNVVKALIEGGANVNKCTRLGAMPIHLTNDEEVMKLLLENGARLNEQSHPGGSTLLNMAIENQNIKAVELLILYGADLYHRNVNGLYPDELARINRQYDIEKCIFEAREFKDRIDQLLKNMQQLSPEHVVFQDNRFVELLKQILFYNMYQRREVLDSIGLLSGENVRGIANKLCTLTMEALFTLSVSFVDRLIMDMSLHFNAGRALASVRDTNQQTLPVEMVDMIASYLPQFNDTQQRLMTSGINLERQRQKSLSHSRV